MSGKSAEERWTRRALVAVCVVVSLVSFLFGGVFFVVFSAPPNPGVTPSLLTVPNINVTSDWYRGATQLTPRLQGQWDVVLNATHGLEATWVNGTTGYYQSGTNLTPRLQGDWDVPINASQGLDANWVNVTSELKAKGDIQLNTSIDTSYLEKEHDWIISSVGSMVYVYNGTMTTTKLFTSDTNATKAFIRCISNASDGDSILIKAGTYSIDKPITDYGKYYITIDGAGKYSTKLDLTAAINGFVITSVNGWVIKNLEIDGNDHAIDAHQGVQFDRVNDSSCRDLYVHHFAQVTEQGRGVRFVKCVNSDMIRIEVRECDHSGLSFVDCEHCDMIDCYGEDCANGPGTNSGIFVLYGTDAANKCLYCNIINCHGIDSENMGVQIYQYCEHCFVRGGYYSDAQTAIVCLGHSSHINTCDNIGATSVSVKMVGNGHGIVVHNSHSIVEDCSIESDGTGTLRGIQISTGVNKCNIVGNVLNGIDSVGIYCQGSYNIIDDNQVKGWGGNYGMYFLTGATHNMIGVNVLENWTQAIRFNAGADNNRLTKPQKYTTVAAAINDMGTDNEFPTISATFVDGTAYNSTAGMAQGWQIDAGGEWASTSITLPLEVGRVVRVNVFGVALVADANNMTLELEMYGATPNEPFTTETITMVTWNSTTVGFAPLDIIRWKAMSGDDADIGHLLGGDSLQIKVLHEAASGPACATAVILRDVTIEYG